MSSSEASAGKSLLATITGEPIAVLIVTQLVATILAIGIGYGVVCQHLGIEHYPKVYAPFAAATVICGIVIGISIVLGYLAFRRAANRITAPLTKMADTAALLSLTRSTTRFDGNADITEIGQFAKALNTLYVAQENQIDDTTDLLESVMHDIRTPLSHIIGQAEKINADNGDPKDAAARIIDGCKIVSRMIADHTEIALNNRKADRTPPEDFDLVEVVATGCELYEGLADADGKSLSASLPPGPVIFHGHKYKLQRLISNLIDNAIKYTPEGGAIRVSLASEDGNVDLRVNNPGIIPEADRPRLFDFHFRGDRSRHRPGSGLGLPMIKSIVTFYNGKISFDSSEENGTTFKALIPKQPT